MLDAAEQWKADPSTASRSCSPGRASRCCSRSRRPARGRPPRWPSCGSAATRSTSAAEEVGLGVRESVADVARTLAGYCAVIAARVFDHATLEEMAAVVDVPVVNLLSDRAHPMPGGGRLPHPARAVRRPRGSPARRTSATATTSPRRSRSRAALSGVELTVASPPGYELDELSRRAGPQPGRHDRPGRRSVRSRRAAPTRCTPTCGRRWARRTRAPARTRRVRGLHRRRRAHGRGGRRRPGSCTACPRTGARRSRRR